MKDTETVKKIESFGHSIGYRWAEMFEFGCYKLIL